MSGRDKIAEMQKIFQSSSQYTHLQVCILMPESAVVALEMIGYILFRAYTPCLSVALQNPPYVSVKNGEACIAARRAAGPGPLWLTLSNS